ncbi:formyltransferase [Olavius algarvensis Delta 1 endosymbiont]|nr:formyltransferase [Olavius algarvensis Delta 1 endosymbiont]
MRIILAGQGPFGEKALDALIQQGEDIVGVFCPKGRAGAAMKGLAESSSIALCQPDHMRDAAVLEAYRDLQPDLVVLAFVTDILPGSLLDIPSIGTICYHPSLLPRHRGSSGINWAVIQGDTRTGLTILWADKGIDTGAILLQKEVDIEPHDTTGSLYFNKLFPMGIDAIVEAVDLIKSGKAPKIKQDESVATYEPPCDEKQAGIDWSKPAPEVYNLIRGCDPQPGAYSTIGGEKVKFYQAELIDGQAPTSPGRIIEISEGKMVVALDGDALKIGKLKGENGAKKAATEFAGEAGLKAGMRFGE